MHRERPDLVGVGGARLAVDPAEQRLDAVAVGRVDEEVDEDRDAPAGFLQVAVDRVRRRNRSVLRRFSATTE